MLCCTSARCPITVTTLFKLRNSSRVTDQNMDPSTSKIDNDKLDELMNVPPVRDGIMNELPPKDVLSFADVSKTTFNDTDLENYTDLFKYVIGDRRWFKTMIEEGYRFTIISEDLNRLMSSADSPFKYSYLHNKDSIGLAKGSIGIAMYVTRDGELVKCTKDFMSKENIEGKEKIVRVTSDALDCGFGAGEIYRSVRIQEATATILLHISISGGSASSPTLMMPTTRWPLMELEDRIIADSTLRSSVVDSDIMHTGFYYLHSGTNVHSVKELTCSVHDTTEETTSEDKVAFIIGPYRDNWREAFPTRNFRIYE